MDVVRDGAFCPVENGILCSLALIFNSRRSRSFLKYLQEGLSHLVSFKYQVRKPYLQSREAPHALFRTEPLIVLRIAVDSVERYERIEPLGSFRIFGA